MQVAESGGYPPGHGQVRGNSRGSRKAKNALEPPALSLQEQDAIRFRWAELESMKQSALRKASRAAGVSQEALDKAEDSQDPKRAIMDLIMAVETTHLRRFRPTSYVNPAGNWVHRSGPSVYEDDVSSKNRQLPKVLQSRVGRPSKSMSRSSQSLPQIVTATLPDSIPVKPRFRPGRGAEDELSDRLKSLETLFLATRGNIASTPYMSDRIQELAKPRATQAPPTLDFRDAPMPQPLMKKKTRSNYIPMSWEERKLMKSESQLGRRDTFDDLEKRLDKIYERNAGTSQAGEGQQVVEKSSSKKSISKKPSSSSLNSSSLKDTKASVSSGSKTSNGIVQKSPSKDDVPVTIDAGEDEEDVAEKPWEKDRLSNAEEADDGYNASESPSHSSSQSGRDRLPRERSRESRDSKKSRDSKRSRSHGSSRSPSRSNASSRSRTPCSNKSDEYDDDEFASPSREVSKKSRETNDSYADDSQSDIDNDKTAKDNDEKADVIKRPSTGPPEVTTNPEALQTPVESSEDDSNDEFEATQSAAVTPVAVKPSSKEHTARLSNTAASSLAEAALGVKVEGSVQKQEHEEHEEHVAELGNVASAGLAKLSLSGELKGPSPKQDPISEEEDEVEVFASRQTSKSGEPSKGGPLTAESNVETKASDVKGNGLEADNIPKTAPAVGIGSEIEDDDDEEEDEFEHTQSAVTSKATTPVVTKRPSAKEETDDEFEESQTPAQTPVAKPKATTPKATTPVVTKRPSAKEETDDEFE